MKPTRVISPNVINRLPRYLRYLQKLDEKGVERTSSAKIAEALNQTASQVRQDLSAFGSYGSTGYGYHVKDLMEEISQIIGVHVPHNIAVIGVGGIGHALLEHMEFEKYNYHVCAAFDVRPEIIGTNINGVQVYSIEEFSKVIMDTPIDICMLAVPTGVAKDIALMLYQNGVPAIWNFTNEELKLDACDIIVQNVNFLDSLFALTYYLEEGISSSRNRREKENARRLYVS